MKPAPRVLEIVATAVYTSHEVADFLRLKSGTLEVWRSCGRYPALRHRKVGGKVVYLGSDVLAFLDSKPERAKPYTPKLRRAPRPRSVRERAAR